VLTAGERLLLTLAKLAVSCACTAGAAIAMNIQPGIEKNMWSPLDNANGALLLTFVATFCVADLWIGVFDSAVEAVFLCYLVDQEENDGDVRPYYSSLVLRTYMERHQPSYQLPVTTPPEIEAVTTSPESEAVTTAPEIEANDDGKIDLRLSPSHSCNS